MLAVFLVLSGPPRRIGRRCVFQIGLAAFGLGWLLCGLAQGIGSLIAARALQADGGTMLNTVAIAIVVNSSTGRAEGHRRVGSMTGLSLALGPILGGRWSTPRLALHLLDQRADRATAMVAAALFVPESRAARARRFDPVGQILMILMLGGVVRDMSRVAGLDVTIILGLLAVACSPRWASSAASRAGPTRCWSCACSAACRRRGDPEALWAVWSALLFMTTSACRTCAALQR